MPLRAAQVVNDVANLAMPFDLAVLTADQRYIRRKLVTLVHGDEVLIDFPRAVLLKDRSRVLLEDGRNFEIIAAEEELLEVKARDVMHHARLAWHIGNRHLEAQIEADRILIRRDHVIEAMLQQQGATLRHVTEPFSPEPGAYSHNHGSEPSGTYTYVP